MVTTYEYKWIGISSDMERDLNKLGKQGWHPASLPPANTAFGPKVLLQRSVAVAAYEAEEQEPELLQETTEDSRLADLERKFRP